MKQQLNQSNRSSAEQLEDIVDQIGELYARADELLDQCIEEARDRKLARAGGSQQLN
jgi:hypothetical protein